jgi:dTDP-4-dehydrorhamnose reductase
MRILLTGTSGQVGRALAPLLAQQGEVIAAARTAFDLAQPATLPAMLDQLSPDLIVNPAAYTAVDRAEDEPDLANAVNADAPGAMARWAAARNVPMVHFSTDYVFDGSGERPWRETDRCAPLGVYGRSKLAGEEAIRAAGGPHLILRTAWVYAAEGANFMRTMIRLGREREALRVWPTRSARQRPHAASQQRSRGSCARGAVICRPASQAPAGWCIWSMPGPRAGMALRRRSWRASLRAGCL